MRLILAAFLTLLSACATYQPSEAKCFSLLDQGDYECDFERLVPVDGLDD